MWLKTPGFTWFSLFWIVCIASAAGQSVPLRTPATDSVAEDAAWQVEGWRNSEGFAARIPPVSTTPDESRVDTLTLAELEQLALASNPTLAQAQRRIGALRGKQLQSGLYPNPVIGYSGEEMGDDGRAGLQGGFIAQEVVTAGKLRLNRAVVGHEVARAVQDMEIQRRRVLNDVRGAAYGVMVAARNVRLQEQLAQISEADTKAAEQLFQAREVSRVDVLQARIEANATRLKLDNARNDFRSAWRRLTTVVGIPGMEPRPLADRLEAEPAELTWEKSLSQLLSHSPELARAHADVERARCAVSRAYAGRVPNVELEAGALYNHGPQDPVASVRLAVPLQLYDRNQGNIHRANAELAMAGREVQRVELALHDRLTATFRRYANARQQVRRYRNEILPDAREALDMVQQGYSEAEFGYLELLTTQRTYFQSQLDYIASLEMLWQSRVQVEGLLLTGALDRPGEGAM